MYKAEILPVPLLYGCETYVLPEGKLELNDLSKVLVYPEVNLVG